MVSSLEEMPHQHHGGIQCLRSPCHVHQATICQSPTFHHVYGFQDSNPHVWVALPKLSHAKCIMMISISKGSQTKTTSRSRASSMWFFQIIGTSWARTCSSTHQWLNTPKPHHLHHSFKGTRTTKPCKPQMTIEWVINVSSTYEGLLHRPQGLSSSLEGSSASSARSWH